MCFWNYQRNHAALFLHCLQLFLASSAHWFLWFLVPLLADPKPLTVSKVWQHWLLMGAIVRHWD